MFLNNQEVKLYVNKILVAKGNTNLVLNNPINSAIWVINKLASKGEIMLKGQFISAGSCTPAIAITNNSKIKADFGKLGIVEIDYI